MASIKRKALSIQDKIKILKVFDEKSQEKNQKQLADELQLPVSTLRTILKNRYKIKDKYRLGSAKRKKQKEGKFVELEKVLVEWTNQARVLKLPINGPILCEKASQIAKTLQITGFNASNGWIHRFKNRHGIEYRQINKKMKNDFSKNEIGINLDDNVESTLYETLGVCGNRLIDPIDTQKEAPSDDDDDEYQEKALSILSTAQALSAINDLRRYVTSLDGTSSKHALKNLNLIEKIIIDNRPK